MYGYLDEANEQLYIYYNNTGAENTDQQLRLNKIRLLPSPGCTAVIQYPVQQEYIQGQQLYSGAGVGYMYDIHPMYDAENTISSEISGSINRIFGGPKKIMLHKIPLGTQSTGADNLQRKAVRSHRPPIAHLSQSRRSVRGHLPRSYR